jgi:REP element-mobilizing transposase RayT
MAVHHLVTQKGIYFITFTCHRWLPLIEACDGYGSVYTFFQALQEKGNTINAYVIMPNHLHFLLHYSGEGKNLNTIIANGKRFMAYKMLQDLYSRNRHDLLFHLQSDVHLIHKERRQQHRFWRDSFDVKECTTEKFLLQKLTYIHNTPVSGKWKLANSVHEYLHSSASYYFNGKQQLFLVKDYRNFLLPFPMDLPL